MNRRTALVRVLAEIDGIIAEAEQESAMPDEDGEEGLQARALRVLADMEQQRERFMRCCGRSKQENNS